MSATENPQTTITNASRVVAMSASTAYIASAAIAVCAAWGAGSKAPWSDGLRWTLYMGAAAAIAMSLGLIFAVPRSRAEYAAGATERYSSNSNLEQISDWLTKLLVGAGLVQLSSLPGWAVKAGSYLGDGMSIPNASAYSVAAIVYGSGVGFLTAYLWTRLRLRSLLEAGDWIAAEVSRQRDSVFDELVKANAASDTPESEGELLRTANSAVRAIRSDPVRGAGILWVDDHPENNASLVSALRELGITVDTATSTAEGLRLFGGGNYALVISDLGRREDGEERDFAGETLIQELRATGSLTPIFIYAGARGIAHRERLTTAGASLVTNRPAELLSRVVSTVTRT